MFLLQRKKVLIDMTKVDAYWILEEMRKECFSKDYAEALGIAQETIEFVDLMPKDMVAVVRCKDCKHRDGEVGQPNIQCYQMHDDDFCSYGERRDENADD